MALCHCKSLTVRGSVPLEVTRAKLSLTFGDQKGKKIRVNFEEAVCVFQSSFT
jgi:hypothetical protein